ncbi:M20 family metallopeptidase [Bradyrhizobium betae]|uniref:M20 family metallopeptidase n=1 Tax=Bradyrhizobium betae TaxID=244734 RepID=UPI003D666062
MIMVEQFAPWIDGNLERIAERLSAYLAIDTVSPREGDAFDFLHEYLQEAGFATREVPIFAETLEHNDACPSPPSRINSGGRKNFCAHYRADDTTETVIVSCHIDVVPAPTWPEAFTPRVVDGIVHGRGACDTKGNLVMLVEAIRFLRESKVALTKNIDFQGVIEEEIGGNGALSMVLQERSRAQAALILEPTSLRLYRGHRGCLGFTLTVHGAAAHMGASVNAIGPVQAAALFVEEMTRVEERLIHEARREPAFDEWPRPIQVNVGRIEGGEWHGTIVDRCRVMVNMGFPPSCGLEKAKAIVEQAVRQLREKCGLAIDVVYDGIRNDAYLDPVQSRLIDAMNRALLDSGVEVGSVNAWNVSCDGRTYAKHLGIPTLIFGCGDLKDAHSNHESLKLDSLVKGIRVMSSFFSASASEKTFSVS